MEITTAKLAGISAVVALAAGAAGGVAGASLADSDIPSVTSTPQPTVTATAPALPTEVQAAPEAPAEIVQQIEENMTVNDVNITDARIYTVADVDVVVALVSSVDVNVDAVGIWTMENNVIVGSANAAAAETTDFEQVDPPADLTQMIEQSETQAALPQASAEELDPALETLISRNTASGSDYWMSGPFKTATVTGSDGRTYTAVAFTAREHADHSGHEHTFGVWIGPELAPATVWEADLTGGNPAGDFDSDAYNTVREAVGHVPLPQQRQQ